MRCVVHRQHNARDNHYNQTEPGETTEIPHIVKVSRRGILMQLMIKHGEYRQAVLNPPNDWIRKFR